MSVYLIIDIAVQEPDLYADYVGQVADVVTRHGGRYLVRGGDIVSMSGDWTPERIIVIEFPSVGALTACFASPEYLALAPLRERSTTSRAIVVDGLRPPR